MPLHTENTHIYAVGGPRAGCWLQTGGSTAEGIGWMASGRRVSCPESWGGSVISGDSARNWQTRQ